MGAYQRYQGRSPRVSKGYVADLRAPSLTVPPQRRCAVGDPGSGCLVLRWQRSWINGREATRAFRNELSLFNDKERLVVELADAGGGPSRSPRVRARVKTQSTERK